MIRQPFWTRTQLAELKKLYEAGVCYKVIAETLDRSVSAIKTRAHMNQFRRPKRCDANSIDALQAQAENLGLDGTLLPRNPSALRILVCLAEADIKTKPGLDVACSISSSTRNRALQLLRLSGLVYVDDLCSPAEVVLTQKAYLSRPEPILTDSVEIGSRNLPTLGELDRKIGTWTQAICRNSASINKYGLFLVRQIFYAQSGDRSTAEVYAIFYRVDTNRTFKAA